MGQKFILTFIISVVVALAVTIAYGLWLQKNEKSICLTLQIDGGTPSAEVKDILLERAQILRGRDKISSCTIEIVSADPTRLKMLVKGRGDLSLFTKALIKPGLIELRLVKDDPELIKKVLEEGKVPHYTLSFIEEELFSAKRPGEKVTRRREFLVKDEPELCCSKLKEVHYRVAGMFPQPIVTIVFSDEDKKKLASITKKYVGERLAIIIDGEIKTAPKIADTIEDGKVEIHGILQRDSAKELAGMLRIGALPCSLRIVGKEISLW